MYQRFSTAEAPKNHESSHWRDAIGRTYFQLQLQFPERQRFQGTLESWQLGLVSLSRLQSHPLHYERQRQHCHAQEPHILITIPSLSDVEFSQLGRNTRCSPGQFVLEHGDEPYEFHYAQDNRMWVLKVPEAALHARVGPVGRYCAQPFNASSGVGRLLSDYLDLITLHCGSEQSESVQSLMGLQLIDLLGTTLKESPSVLQSSLSSVRSAHLARIETYARQHLGNPQLCPQALAAHGGISLRYLHDLFKDTGQSVSQWIRALRLQSAYEQLLAGPAQSLAQIAYGCGFTDQTQFSHAFRRHYQMSPSELLKRQRQPLAPPSRI